MSSPPEADPSGKSPDHCGVDTHHRVSPAGGINWAMEKTGRDSVVSRAAARERLKPTFRTQASALMKKNLVYQKRNWKANLCLVISPVVFSVVLAIIQVVINNLFDDDRYRCGCQCAVYESTSTGESFSLADHRVNGTNFWPLTVKSNSTSATFRVPSDMTCKQRDYGLCGLEYSQGVSIIWCPIKSPVRIPTVAQIPAAAWRARVPGVTVSDNQTDVDTNADGDPVTFSAANLPVTIPYMARKRPPAGSGNDAALASDLVRLMLNSNTSVQAMAAFVSNTLERVVREKYAGLKSINPTSFAFISPLMQAFGEANNSAALKTFNADGEPDLNLLGGLPIMGTSRRAGAQLQSDGAFTSAGGGQAQKPAFSYLLENCTAQAELNYPVPANVTALLSTLLKSARALRTWCNGTAPAANCTPATVRNAMEALGDALALTPFKCVSAQFKYFSTAQGVNELLFAGYGKGNVSDQSRDQKLLEANIQQYPFAVDFMDTAPAAAQPRLRFNMWYNNTDIISDSAGWIRYRRINAVMNAATNAFLTKLFDPDSQAPRPLARMLFLRDQPKDGTALAVDFSSFLGPLFYTWLSQMLLPVMVGLLVYEKEKNLRSMMKMQGLGDASYWIINYAYYFVIHFCFQLLVWLFGAALGISMFLLTTPGVIVLFYILFTNVQVAIAFLMHAVFHTSKVATVITVVYVIIFGLLGEFLLKPYIQSADFSRGSILGMQIIVPFSLYRGYYEMASEALVGQWTSSQGLTMDKVRSVPQGMGAVYATFLVEWVVLLLVAFYLEQVVSSGSGVKKHPLFFLDPILRRRRRGPAGLAEEASHSEYVVPEAPADEPGDVRAQREYAEHSADRSRTPIIAYRLGKTYPGRDGAPPKVACRNFSLAIPKGEVFGLLGPNGAGKSTSINMLIGFLAPSSGTAFIEWLDIREEMDTVYTLLGVCPQHDLLWETLTAREHLRFYGRLKNLKGKELETAVDEALQSVNLFAGGVGDKQVGGFSGGMKRRLSVAISLIGNPLVVFLDEPSTGLDPASRQQLWGVIKAAKADRAMVLTTHSMEEAEELCDRLGIFVDGALQCIGNPKELTNRYGGFLILTLTTPAKRVADVREFVTSKIAKSGKCTYAVGGTQTFEVPTDETDLSEVFKQVEAHRKELEVEDFGCSNMTLEEVFIKISRQIGAETKDF